jgi:hypothetical protein
VNLHHHCTTAAPVCTTNNTHVPAFAGAVDGIATRNAGVVVRGAVSRRLHHLDARSASHCGRFLFGADPHHHCTTAGKADPVKCPICGGPHLREACPLFWSNPCRDAVSQPLSAQANNSAGAPGEGEARVH